MPYIAKRVVSKTIQTNGPVFGAGLERRKTEKGEGESKQVHYLINQPSYIYIFECNLFSLKYNWQVKIKKKGTIDKLLSTDNYQIKNVVTIILQQIGENL